MVFDVSPGVVEYQSQLSHDPIVQVSLFEESIDQLMDEEW
jgi:hypothetical protein